MEPFWSRHSRRWVTFDTPTTRMALDGEQVHWAFSPTNRNLPNLLRNTLLSWSVLLHHRPDLILSTGAGVAVPLSLIHI